MLRQNIAVLWLKMVKYLQIALNIELEILFESFVHNFLQVYILHTNMQNDVVIKLSSFIA